MFAVIKAGGRQYKVEPGRLVRVDRMEAAVGEEVTWSEVLVLGNEEHILVGSPLVKDARVIGQVESQGRGKKIIVYKQKRRKGYSKKQGHRQDFTAVRIKEIVAEGMSEKEEKRQEPAARKEEADGA